MKWIKSRREELNYSQDDLSRLLQLSGIDVGRSSIGHWESGRTVPTLTPQLVEVLATTLKLDPITVLELCGYQVPATHTEAGERIARLVDRMPVDRQQLALKLVEAMLE